MSEHDQQPSDELDIAVGVRPSPKTSARRYLAAFAAASVAVATVGAGIWAWNAWSATGAQPAEALPGDTLAYLALDLDPSGGQKVAAFRALRKIPSLKKELGLDSADDVSKSVVEGLADDNDCDLNFDKSFKPWVGDRAAVALLAGTRPEPIAVLQIKDAAKARAGLKSALSACGETGLGYLIDGDWAVVARNKEVASRVQKDAARRKLSDDKDFRALTAGAGDAGLVTLYAAPEAGKALLDAIDQDPLTAWTAISMLNMASDPVTSNLTTFGAVFAAGSVVGMSEVESSDSYSESSSEMTPELRSIMKRYERYDELTAAEKAQLERDEAKYYASQPDEPVVEDEDAVDDFPAPKLAPELRKSLETFSGIGGVARFDDGGLEIEIAGDQIKGNSGDLYAGKAGDDLVTTLPEDTAIAYGTGFSDGWAGKLIGTFNSQLNYTNQTDAEATKAFEKATGLDLPADVEALGGKKIAIVAGAGFAPEQLDKDLEKAHLALRISGDPAKIEAALTKLRTKIGADGAPYLTSQRAGDDVVVGPSKAYLAEIAGDGKGLGDTDTFERVVPDAKDATSVMFVNFDAGNWLANLVGSAEERKDVDPLDALGMTVTKKGDQQRILLRLSFD